ncbi:pyroglutamyl peptidase [Streptomyces sp. NBC_00536]|uniref:pyroglutamyl peptidase n=1 Tax=Streptomyces sp. NBC_00536 TaxID=2975769 RepID=UPI002E7FF585|nr:pyroglutamyl peptidase [Streptomyces sp. NBC_00536]WUC77163.1 pyroglutamyl peptidase [Streptomyces sp. NBC_00536]
MMILRRAALAAVFLGITAVLPPAAAHAAAPDACGASPSGCTSSPAAAPACSAAASVPASVPDPEQARLADPRTTALVERAAFGDFVRRFPAALCGARDAAEAGRLLDAWGEALWQAAVNRAQGRRPGGDLAAGDDRPLYWTRLRMTVELADWNPGFPVDHQALRTRFEDASRGLTANEFRGTPGVRRLFVSGFDPFGLDTEPRRANPSGSAVLRLNGRRVTLADGTPAEIRAVVLPVRYADFDAGIVERAYGPRLRSGPRAADMITSISQGYPGIFTLEAWAGRARSADPYPDNADALSGGTYDHPVTAPGMGPGAEFLRTTLPTDTMTAVQSPYPVRLNTEVTEIPAGQEAPVDREDGPTPGSRAVAGGGGGYLSNEVAYRSNRLRTELRPGLPGGHLHTPVLTGLPAEPDRLTDAAFDRNESDIAAEVLAVLRNSTPGGS